MLIVKSAADTESSPSGTSGQSVSVGVSSSTNLEKTWVKSLTSSELILAGKSDET